jgi:thymidine kinase
MSSSGAVTLGDIADKITMLEVSCSRCGRYGRLRVARLIERHGENAKLPALRQILAGDCPRVGAASVYERCGVRYPQLPKLLGAAR